MRWIKLTVIYWIFSASIIQAQNLVPNYSFENYTQCPQYPQFEGYVSSWGGGYPEYFHTYPCQDTMSGAITGGVPANAAGFQSAHTDSAYAGIYTFIKTVNNIRDYLQGALSTSLIANTRYYVTFYVSLADSEQYACNSIGAYFSVDTLTYTGSRTVQPYTPQVANDGTQNPLTDKIGWTKVSGNFIAQGGEKYIIIGNFKDDAHSDTTFVNSTASNGNYTWDAAYYYVDDVIVSPDSAYADSLMTAVEAGKNNISTVKVFPNPANDNFYIELKNAPASKYQFCLYNSLGEEVLGKTLRVNENSIPSTSLPTGLYYYRIVGKSKFVKAGKVMVVH